LADDFDIWYGGLDVDSKQLFLITFCRICYIKGTLLYSKIVFFENFHDILDDKICDLKKKEPKIVYYVMRSKNEVLCAAAGRLAAERK
jgi:hypothetical protein